VPQHHRRARFYLKSISSGLILDEALVQDLDRDGPVHLKMPRTIHRSHPARTEAFFYGVLVVERSTYERVLCFEHGHCETDLAQSGVT
jgi:hypothetical protein